MIGFLVANYDIKEILDIKAYKSFFIFQYILTRKLKIFLKEFFRD